MSARKKESMAMHCKQHRIEVHKVIVQLLLEREADTNSQGGLYGNALQAVSAGGHSMFHFLSLTKYQLDETHSKLQTTNRHW